MLRGCEAFTMCLGLQLTGRVRAHDFVWASKFDGGHTQLFARHKQQMVDAHVII